MFAELGFFELILFIGSALGTIAFLRSKNPSSELSYLRLELRTLRTQFESLAEHIRKQETAKTPTTSTSVKSNEPQSENDAPLRPSSPTAAQQTKTNAPLRPVARTVAKPAKNPAVTAIASQTPNPISAWKDHYSQTARTQVDENGQTKPPEELEESHKPEKSVQTAAPKRPAEPLKTAGANFARRVSTKKNALLEELGARWSVWVGGIVLALGAIFFLRHSIEAGFFGPGVRIFVASTFGILTLAVGEWLRRSEKGSREKPIWNAYIPGVLTAVGILTLFGSAYVSYAVYDFIGTIVAFGLLGLISLGALTLGLLQGPAISGLGLIGSMVTPLLVTSQQPSFAALYTYLIFVMACAMVLGRAREWTWLSLSAPVASLAWALAGIFFHAGDELVVWLAYLSTGFGMILLINVSKIVPFGNSDNQFTNRYLPLAAYVASAVLLLLMLKEDGTSAVIFMACLGGVFVGLFVALLWPSLTWIAPAAALLFLFALSARGLEVLGWWSQVPGQNLPTPTPIEGEWGLLFLINCVISATLLIVSTLAARQAMTTAQKSNGVDNAEAKHFTPALLWASVGAIAPLSSFAILWLYGAGGELQTAFSLTGFALTASTWLAVGWLWRDPSSRQIPASIDLIDLLTPTNLFAGSAGAALMFALFSGISGMPLTLAMTGLVPAIAYVYLLRPIPILRIVCASFGVLLIQYVLFTINNTNGAIGGTVIFNELWLYLALPAVACWQASRLLSRRHSDLWSQAAEALTLSFAALFAVFQVRHYMHGGDLFAPELTLDEMSLQVLVGLSYSLGLSRIQSAKPRSLFPIASMLAMGVTVVSLVFGNMLVFNPVFNASSQVNGGLIFNSLFLAYLLPGLFLAAIAWLQRERRPAWYLEVLGTLSIVLLFTYVSSAVRFGFQGQDATALLVASPTALEIYAYILVWILLALTVQGTDKILEGRKDPLGPALTRVLYRGMHATGLVAFAGMVLGNLLAFNPLLVESASVEGGIVFNSLMLAFLLPGLLLAGLVWWQREKCQKWYLDLLGTLSLVLLFTYVTSVVRFGFQGQDATALLVASPGALEMYAYILAWALLALAVYVTDKVLEDRKYSLGPALPRILYRGMHATGLVAFVGAIAGNLLAFNPLLVESASVEGSIVFNSLMLAFLLPGLILAGLVWLQRGKCQTWYLYLGGTLPFLLLFAYITSVVRLGFQGAETTALLLASPGALETYTYSLIWLLFAMTLHASDQILIGRTIVLGPVLTRVFHGAMQAIGIVAIAGIVLGNLIVANPLLAESATVQGGPIFNGLVVAYLSPGILLGLFICLRRTQLPRYQIRLAGGLSLALAFTYFTAAIRLAYHLPADMSLLAFTIRDLEVYTYTLVWFLFGLLLLAATAYVDRTKLLLRNDILEILKTGAMLVTGLSGSSLIFGNLIIANPMIFEAALVHGGLIFNSLLLAFLLPGLFLGFAAQRFRHQDASWHRAASTLCGGFALLSIIVYGTSLVRLMFQSNETMSVFHYAITNVEQYTYSTVWLLFGITLLAAGLIRKSRNLRAASAVVMILTVGKAFLIDMAALEGILRALSFVGLGAALIGIGLVYQRLLVKSDQPEIAVP